MTRLTGFACLCTSLLLPAGLLAQAAAPAAAPEPPSKKILIHIHSDNPADWQAAMDKANATMSSAKPGSTVVEMLVTGDGLKLIEVIPNFSVTSRCWASTWSWKVTAGKRGRRTAPGCSTARSTARCRACSG